MNKYYNLLGLSVKEVEKYFDEKNIKYHTIYIEGGKDKERLTNPRAIRISEIADSVEITATYFSDSLL